MSEDVESSAESGGQPQPKAGEAPEKTSGTGQAGAPPAMAEVVARYRVVVPR